MNKKIIISIIVVFVVAVLVFFIAVRREPSDPPTELPRLPLRDTVENIRSEAETLNEAVWRGEIDLEEADARLTNIEENTAVLIYQHGFEAAVEDFFAQQKLAEEVYQRFETWTLKLRPLSEVIAEAEIDTDDVADLRTDINALNSIALGFLAGEIEPKEADARLTAIEDKLAELAARHGIEDKMEEHVARELARERAEQQAVEELQQWLESQLWAIDRQLAGTKEYFSQKPDKETELAQARALRDELWLFSEEIWEQEMSQADIEKRLNEFENTVSEMISQHGIKAEVDEYVATIEDSLDRISAIEPRIAEIQKKLTAIELISGM